MFEIIHPNNLLEGYEEDITAISVVYNTPDLIERMVKSFRQFYNIKLIVIDGSSSKNYSKLIKFNLDSFENVLLDSIGYNIHHGPGLDYAINKYVDTDYFLTLDSDLIFVGKGMVEGMYMYLKGEANVLAAGMKCYIDHDGYDTKDFKNAIEYIHPSISLYNTINYKNLGAKFIKHGAPAIEIYKRLAYTNFKIKEMPRDFNYIHEFDGTVDRFGYNL